LSNNQLFGTLPTEIGLLTQLESLGLILNQLNGTLPTQIGKLQSLEDFGASNNKFESTIPSEIQNCWNLEALYISLNRFRGNFSIQNHASLKAIDISMNNLNQMVLKNNPMLSKVQAQYNHMVMVDITNNTALAWLNLQSNLIVTFPSFLMGNDSQPLATVNLASNKINETLPEWLFNTNLINLDLSRNLIFGQKNKISFFSEATGQPDQTRCDNSHLLADPERRSINLIGNRLNLSRVEVVEKGAYQERGWRCMVLGNSDDRHGYTNIIPQECETKGHHLNADLECESCYSDWKNNVFKDTEDWSDVLEDLGLPVDCPFHEYTYSTCSQCKDGFRRRTKVVSTNRECDYLESIVEEVEPCWYPCVLNNASLLPNNILPQLIHELSKNMTFWDQKDLWFLPLLVESLFPEKNISVLLPSGDQVYSKEGEMKIYSVKLIVENCDEETLEDLKEIVETVSNEIVAPHTVRVFGTISELIIETRVCPEEEFPSLTEARKCDSCFTDWQTSHEYLSDPDGWDSILSSLGFTADLRREFALQTYGTCENNCDDGERIQVRTIKEDVPCQHLATRKELLLKKVRCNYPCRSEYGLNRTDTFKYLLRQLNEPLDIDGTVFFLPLLVSTMFPNVSISVPNNTESLLSNAFVDFFYSVIEIKFNITGCSDQSQYRDISKTVLAVCSAVVPFAQFEARPSNTDFSHVLLFQDNVDTLRVSSIATPVAIIITTPIVAFLCFLLFIFLRYWTSELRTLPEEMSWSYFLYMKKPWEWDKQGSERTSIPSSDAPSLSCSFHVPKGASPSSFTQISLFFTDFEEIPKLATLQIFRTKPTHVQNVRFFSARLLFFKSSNLPKFSICHLGAWFHFRDFKTGTPEWKRVRKLFDNYLDGSRFNIESIKAVYNPNLTTAFLSTWNTRDSRRDDELFAISYENDPLFEQRGFVSECFKEKVKKMEWNSEKEGNWIVPVVHGTSFDSAMSICQRGFASLGKTDGGWYGKGTQKKKPFHVLILFSRGLFHELCHLYAELHEINESTRNDHQLGPSRFAFYQPQPPVFVFGTYFLI
jgi:hypothetical protein